MRKDVFKLKRCWILLCLLLLVIIPVLLMAQVPQVVNYQGRLTDTDGNPVADGPYQITFTIWNDPSASAPGNEKWSSGEQTVQVTGGLFNYLLGSVEPYLTGDVFTDSLCWLGIKVREDPEISPRTKLASVAFAYRAGTADMATAVGLTPTAEPGTCDGDGTGAIYYDSYLNELCYCNGTNWVQVDGGGDCDCRDEDSDGYDTCDPGNPHDMDGQPADCDDGNDLINPGETEICDGLDNDCNNAIDDGDPGGGGYCNTGQQGVCADGIMHCQNGTLVCEQVEQPVAEICDGLDNDCDGAVDEGNPGGGGGCNTGLQGVCANGTMQCQAGALVCVQDESATPEVCDGLDNDCDGAVDEGNPGGGSPCNTGLPGECAQGTMQCQGGTLVCVQDYSATAEICDGLDNDCDGAVDEGDPGGGSPCNTGLQGVCANGTMQCVAGALVCVQDESATPEVCDGLDNDCDGAVDEGDPGGGGACNTGLPGVCAQGTMQCQGGTLVCVQDYSATAEICDGLDNDCDGAVDEGNPGGGGACNTGLPGVCAQGTLQCVAGVLQCVQNTQATPEICDGLDNDCDGAVDEGNPGGGGTCDTGLQGECANGTLQCVAGVLQCVQTIFPVTENCTDGLDNDCDGLTDMSDPDCP